MCDQPRLTTPYNENLNVPDQRGDLSGTGNLVSNNLQMISESSSKNFAGPRVAYNFSMAILIFFNSSPVQYFFLSSFYCSWKCNVSGASHIDSNHGGSNTGALPPLEERVTGHDLLLHNHIRSAEMLGALQHRSHPSSNFRDISIFQISSVHTHVRNQLPFTINFFSVNGIKRMIEQ